MPYYKNKTNNDISIQFGKNKYFFPKGKIVFAVSDMWAIRFPTHLAKVTDKPIKEMKPKIKLQRLIDPTPKIIIAEKEIKVEKAPEMIKEEITIPDVGTKILEQVLEEVKEMPIEQYVELYDSAEDNEDIKITDLDVFHEDVVGTVIDEKMSTGLKLFQEDLKEILNGIKKEEITDGTISEEKWIEELALDFVKNSK